MVIAQIANGSKVNLEPGMKFIFVPFKQALKDSRPPGIYDAMEVPMKGIQILKACHMDKNNTEVYIYTVDGKGWAFNSKWIEQVIGTEADNNGNYW